MRVSVSDRRLRVAMDMTFPNRNRAGTGLYANELRGALRNRDDVEVTTVSASESGELPSTVGWLLTGARKAVVGTQLVHCPAGIAPWRLGAPFVVTVHDTMASEFREDHAFEWRAYASVVLPRRARAAARVIVGSECLRRELVQTLGLPAERVAVTPYGISTRYSTQHHWQSRDNPVLLFPGAPLRRKNLELVLEAMASAARGSKLSSARLAITGADAAQFPRHRDRIKASGLESRVDWRGRLPQETMTELIATADLVVYPSFHEGFGFPGLEAMAAGTPVLASSAPCLPDVLGDGALFVDPTDVRAFIERAEALLTKESLHRELAARGKARAAQFTWQRCADLTVEVYREAVRVHQ